MQELKHNIKIRLRHQQNCTTRLCVSQHEKEKKGRQSIWIETLNNSIRVSNHFEDNSGENHNSNATYDDSRPERMGNSMWMDRELRYCWKTSFISQFRQLGGCNKPALICDFHFSVLSRSSSSSSIGCEKTSLQHVRIANIENRLTDSVK